ncbi:hypothetical protein B296_00029827 [Ensete ventricosum]|uniref:C2H2-type domain-containing protein n=1 Tax=Ensete ventricosum TaxID=4639 RepID=A0A427AK30_ENSVE|nr:hypothetical protein B296_00029827 [Ensete ventricosum]
MHPSPASLCTSSLSGVMLILHGLAPHETPTNCTSRRRNNISTNHSVHCRRAPTKHPTISDTHRTSPLCISYRRLQQIGKEIEGIQCQAKGTTSPQLKLFGFHVSDNDNPNPDNGSDDRRAAIGSPSFVASNGEDGRKYECQYQCQEFANSQGLCSHQNTHKEQQQMKRAQLHHHHATSDHRSPHGTLYHQYEILI